MTRAKKIITAFQLFGLLGFFVILGSANDSASIETNILTAFVGFVMISVASVACVYIRSLRRKRWGEGQ